MRLLLPLALFLVSAPASAQIQSESDKAWAEVQKSSAEALASQDCRVACRALESLQRATRRLCDIGPEHCEEARAKLKDATNRVRTTCPECEVQTVQPGVDPKTATQPPPEGRAGGSSDQAVATEAAPSKSGGCASCNASHADPSVFGVLALAFLMLRKKSKR
jgi:hypothetical protein